MEVFAKAGGRRWQVRQADTFWKRFKGLLGTKELPEDACLWLEPCDSVHMMGMRYALDIVYLDEKRRILKIVSHLTPPFGMSVCRAAQSALEFRAGTAEKEGWYPGLTLHIE